MPIEPSLEQDRRLVQRLKRRDPDAMMELYDRYARLLYSIIYRAVHNYSVAEDITQEAFLRVWNRIVTFDEERGNLEGWLVTIARNRAFDYLRSLRNTAGQSTVSLTDFERSGSLPPTGSGAEQLALANLVGEALKALNRDQREVIELTHFEGMTQTEIAGKLKKPLGTVKSLVRSALKSLRLAVGSASSGQPESSSNAVSRSQEVRNDL